VATSYSDAQYKLSLHQPLVLAGAGHAHLVALRQWAATGFKVPKGSVLISPHTHAWYSGMMPALFAGRFAPEDCAIDLAPLCESVGLQLQIGQVTDLHADRCALILDTQEEIDYRILSINTGSRPPPLSSDGSIQAVTPKPFADLHAAWQGWRTSNPATLAILGGGAASFELALALRSSLPQTRLTLICASVLFPSSGRGLRKAAGRLLVGKGISLLENIRIDRIEGGALCSADMCLPGVDAVVLATGAAPLSWYATSGLSCDAAAFPRVNQQLQSISHPFVFVTGDACSLTGAARSGVYAVRQGSVLASNIAAMLQNRMLRPYHPQWQALALMATGDGGALLSYGQLSVTAALLRPALGRWKDALDTSFINRHRLSA
jgi:NADH dehydrogenase FAD-containing subunit